MKYLFESPIKIRNAVELMRSKEHYLYNFRHFGPMYLFESDSDMEWKESKNNLLIRYFSGFKGKFEFLGKISVVQSKDERTKIELNVNYSWPNLLIISVITTCVLYTTSVLTYENIIEYSMMLISKELFWKKNFDYWSLLFVGLLFPFLGFIHLLLISKEIKKEFERVLVSYLGYDIQYIKKKIF